MRTLAFICAGALAVPGLAVAQSRDGALEETVIVTAPIEGALIESLQGAEILRRDELVASLNGGLGDTLEHLPGVASTFYGAGASRPIIRGLGDDRIRILQNGIGTIDASSASPDHAVSSDGLDAQRIEVLRGAAALAYGGNAIGGVVNVIDQSIPTRALVDGLEGDALAGYTSVNDGGEGALGVTFGSGMFVGRLSGGVRTTEDYDTPEGVEDNSQTEFQTLAAGAGVVGAWGYFGVAVKTTDSEYGLPGEGEQGGDEENNARIELEQMRIEARGELRIDVGVFDRLDMAVQSGDYEHTEFEPNGEAGTRFENDGWEARLEAHHNGFGEKLNGAIGVQAISSDFAAIGEEAFITPTTTEDMGVFAVERLDLGRWGIEAGARYETRDIDNEGGGQKDFDAVSGSAGVFFRPAQNWFVGATVARTERAPTAIELFADGPHLATAAYEIGDAELDIETANSIELSLRYTTTPFKFEINLYQVQFEDYIALVQNGQYFWLDEENEADGFADSEDDPSIPEGAETLPVYTFTAQDATFTGGEISGAARLFEAGAFTINADAAYDIVRAEFDAGGRPPRIPPATTTLGISAESAKLDARLEWIDVADQDRTADFETATEGYQFVNARLSYRPLPDDALSIILDARNLTDELARAHTSFLKEDLPLPGRSVRLAVATRF